MAEGGEGVFAGAAFGTVIEQADAAVRAEIDFGVFEIDRALA